MEEPDNLFNCSLLLYSMFPSLLCMFLYMPFPRSTINVHKLCKRLGAFHVLFYTLIYTGQKKHWMFNLSVVDLLCIQVQRGRNWMVLSITQLVNQSTISWSKNNNNNNKNVPQMCSSLKWGSKWSTEQLQFIIYCIDKQPAIYSALSLFHTLGRYANLSKFSLPQLLGKVGSPSQTAEPCTQCQTHL